MKKTQLWERAQEFKEREEERVTEMGEASWNRACARNWWAPDGPGGEEGAVDRDGEGHEAH